MNKEKLRRKLIWKYFWKRKRQEIWGFIKFLSPGLLFLLWIISLIITTKYPEDSIIFIIGAWIAILPIVLLYISGIVFILYSIYRIFIKWLRQNWEWATKDADIELRKRSRKK